MVLEDIQQEAADKVSVGSNIGSFRFLGSMGGRKFVERNECRREGTAQEFCWHI